jgi:hypothetical protein
MAKPKLNCKLPSGSRVTVYVTNEKGEIVFIIYTDPQGHMHIIENSAGAKPIV